jgi:hypothetical protein
MEEVIYYSLEEDTNEGLVQSMVYDSFALY